MCSLKKIVLITCMFVVVCGLLSVVASQCGGFSGAAQGLGWSGFRSCSLWA